MVSYKYKLYNSKHNKHLSAMLMDASFVWNHCLALHKRYYRMFGKFINANRLKTHFAKRYRMQRLHSQTVQEVIERLDTAYRRFFDHIAKRPPKFKRAKDFTSIVFKQGGYKIEENRLEKPGRRDPRGRRPLDHGKFFNFDPQGILADGVIFILFIGGLSYFGARGQAAFGLGGHAAPVFPIESAWLS